MLPREFCSLYQHMASPYPLTAGRVIFLKKGNIVKYDLYAIS